ncbi:MAG: hypothetical protein JSU85_15710 [Candidatus Zixiibacteriota bacterium]|nr:MAG: hypothetical protein JSU85_15710 [candidate division Zixibacteria bacterium]
MRSLIFAAVLFFTVSCVPREVLSSGRAFQISVQAGPVAPADRMLQGDQRVEYDASSGFGYPVVRGFGNGVDPVLGGEYYFTD